MGKDAFEPPFEVLKDIGDPETVPAARAPGEPPAPGHRISSSSRSGAHRPPNDKALAAVAAEHYNLTWVPVEGLDAAARHGLRAMLTSDLLEPGRPGRPGQRAPGSTR